MNAYEQTAMDKRIKRDGRGTDARNDFAQRLRALRIPRGFRTARSLARALEIDENRYTRYERAEVEPDLALIRRICGTLKVSPNELLSERDDHDAVPGGAVGTRLRRGGKKGSVIGAEPHREATKGNLDVAVAAWALAEAVTRLKRDGATDLGGDGANESPLIEMGQTGALYQDIMSQPFEAISGLLSDPVVQAAEPQAAADLHARIERLVERLKMSPETD